MHNTIIYLIGHYGVGKLTIARAICAATDARLFDNHLANNVIFSLIRADGKTPLPEGVWDLIDVVRQVIIEQAGIGDGTDGLGNRQLADAIVADEIDDGVVHCSPASKA